jgi:predicted ATPase
MITEISVDNFKCFNNNETFTFGKLNLLTGINGRGKSSLLQTLLLMSQTLRQLKTPQRLLINGEWVELGTFDDIKNSSSKKKNIAFHFKTDDDEQNDLRFEYGEVAKNARIANLTSLIIDGDDKFIEMSEATESPNETSSSVNNAKTLIPLGSLNTSSIFHKFHFIAADRLGPVEYVKKKDIPESLQLGIKGENLVNVLAFNGNDIEVNNLVRRGSGSSNLINQTIEWLSYILDGANININGTEKASSILMMMINSQADGHSYKPSNVGFGYSYILPLIVTGLLAKSGDVVIMENPEAHLHPRAQSRIAEFFSKVASYGVQVFIESHSEHILNGLRVSALNPEIKINYDQIAIHYFNESYKAEKLVMTEKAKIINWPDGFFDQQEIDLSDIFKYSR